MGNVTWALVEAEYTVASLPTTVAMRTIEGGAASGQWSL